MENNIEDFYAILDEFNARLEDIINEYNDSDTLDVIIPLFSQKVEEFIADFQLEVEKNHLIEMEM